LKAQNNLSTITNSGSSLFITIALFHRKDGKNESRGRGTHQSNGYLCESFTMWRLQGEWGRDRHRQGQICPDALLWDVNTCHSDLWPLDLESECIDLNLGLLLTSSWLCDCLEPQYSHLNKR
jgi:hypothetical protein